MRRLLTIRGIVALLVIAAVGVASYRYFLADIHAPIAGISASATYDVPRGASLTSVLRDLKARGWLTHPRAVALWARYMRPDIKLRAGEYELNEGMTTLDLLELLASGRVLLHKLTIVEGSSLRDLRRLLAAQPDLEPTTRDWSESKLLQTLAPKNRNFPTLEGLFYPDTYRFPKGTSDLDILKLARDRMQTELERAWNSRDVAVPLANPYEALILASIVEKETALGSERPVIAGVFTERLRRGMRLQTDPTVIYGIGADYDGNIRRADLTRDGPYNTYTRAGLPPTPICMPGAAALMAAVRPQTTGALFFVATGNGDGGHYFSKTLEEHNIALQKYLRTLRQRR
ncbi:MAG TPA: endolytic transglycosylase MltG [Steroidobacteraceae bacterium]|nr:endolytic transglycosylase MltG [Steroidobacteraceae bacterium]